MNAKGGTSCLAGFEFRVDKPNSRTWVPVFIQFDEEYVTGKRENPIVVNPARNPRNVFAILDVENLREFPFELKFRELHSVAVWLALFLLATCRCGAKAQEKQRSETC